MKKSKEQFTATANTMVSSFPPGVYNSIQYYGLHQVMVNLISQELQKEYQDGYNEALKGFPINK